MPLAIVLLVGAFASPAHAFTEGTVSGRVTAPGGGPVAGATVVLQGENNNQRQATTGADGSYSVFAWPDTYRISALPPRGFNASVTSRAGHLLGDGAAITVDLVLSADLSPAPISGNASYPDHSPNAGVEVHVYEAFRNGIVWSQATRTDASGNWDLGKAPPAIYYVNYSVNISDGIPSRRKTVSVGRDVIVATAGGTFVLSTILDGPKPEGTLEIEVLAAEGWETDSTVTLRFPDGGTQVSGTYSGRPAILFAPTGPYTLTIEPDTQDLMDESATTTVTAVNGQVTRLTIQLSPLGLPGGIEPQREQTLLGWLNAQRARWGLPAGIVNVPLWSRGCAAHDAFGARNRRLEHEEEPQLPGFSAGGHWAGTHAVLAAGGGWGPQANPWMDAPFHMAQLFAPWLTKIGLDDSHDYQCATTWPGMDWHLAEPGTVWTFPGDGSTGLPPVEYASERPTTPNRILGLPDLTGRQLLVYEQGEPGWMGSTDILSASLSSPAGKVAIKTLNLGGLGIGSSVVIPVNPLEPWTTYTARVTLAPVVGTDDQDIAPQKTHTWSFTTGHYNPNGYWGEKPRRKVKRRVRRVVRVRYRRGHVVVRGRRFRRGRVVIKRKTLLKRLRRQNGRVMARTRATARGNFIARIRWPRRKRLALRVHQHGRSTFGLYDPPKKRKGQRKGKSSA